MVLAVEGKTKMTPREFCYWFRGFFELNVHTPKSELGLSASQAEIISKHLNLVFNCKVQPLLDIGKGTD